MKRTALVLVLLAACGGKQPTPAQPTTEEAPTAPAETATATEAAATTESAQPAEPAKPDDSVLAQAALAEQYAAGKKIYTEKKCATCHGDSGAGNPKNPPVIGEKAFPEAAPKTAKLRKGVAFKTAKDVMDFVKAKMPIKAPNTLTDDEAAAVTAWMLSESKVNIEKKLDASNAAAISLRAAQ
jgi:mono/diheme cytochrome c family protein